MSMNILSLSLSLSRLSFWRLDLSRHGLELFTMVLLPINPHMATTVNHNMYFQFMI
jgi:hypothetical protein